MSSLVLVPPLGFSLVSSSSSGAVYRSSYPAKKSLPFLAKLGLKSIICLSPNDLRPEFREFCTSNAVALMEYDLKVNQEPFAVMDEEVMEAVLSAADCKSDERREEAMGWKGDGELSR
jgi:tyrosine-protein phosphatase SIW14